MTTPVVYLDDADAVVTFEVTDSGGQDVDWASPVVSVAGGAWTAAEWVGAPAASRQLRLPMPLGLGLVRGTYRVHLQVPNATDIQLGWVTVETRS
jgi:hypothetical protein